MKQQLNSTSDKDYKRNSKEEIKLRGNNLGERKRTKNHLQSHSLCLSGNSSEIRLEIRNKNDQIPLQAKRDVDNYAKAAIARHECPGHRLQSK